MCCWYRKWNKLTIWCIIDIISDVATLINNHVMRVIHLYVTILCKLFSLAYVLLIYLLLWRSTFVHLTWVYLLTYNEIKFLDLLCMMKKINEINIKIVESVLVNKYSNWSFQYAWVSLTWINIVTVLVETMWLEDRRKKSSIPTNCSILEIKTLESLKILICLSEISICMEEIWFN
jgi:hypothetical protein